jgi:hypothetical protein
MHQVSVAGPLLQVYEGDRFGRVLKFALFGIEHVIAKAENNPSPSARPKRTSLKKKESSP